MKKLTIRLFGTFSYLVGLAGLTAFMLFMGSWSFLPIHINSASTDTTTVEAVSINVLIMLLFGLHHSIAARGGFKARLIRIMPAAVERSTYVLISGLFMFAICLFWQPLSGTVWNLENSLLVLILKCVHVLGWIIMVAATFEIDHFHLMGLKQSLSMNPSEGDTLKENFLYKVVRHPIQSGILLGIWSTANMSTTQFMLAICLSGYIVIGLYYEEKSLIAHFGDVYIDYKKRVPAVVPFWPAG